VERELASSDDTSPLSRRSARRLSSADDAIRPVLRSGPGTAGVKTLDNPDGARQQVSLAITAELMRLVPARAEPGLTRSAYGPVRAGPRVRRQRMRSTTRQTSRHADDWMCTTLCTGFTPTRLGIWTSAPEARDAPLKEEGRQLAWRSVDARARRVESTAVDATKRLTVHRPCCSRMRPSFVTQESE